MDLTQPVKILNKKLKHHDFQYQIGLNIDDKKFTYDSCQAGGLNFTTLEHMAHFFIYGQYVANVTIPKNAQVYADPEGNKWKADKLIISNIIKIEDHPCWSDKIFCFKAVTINGMNLKFVRLQSEEICIKAIRNDIDALKYVFDITDEISLEVKKLLINVKFNAYPEIEDYKEPKYLSFRYTTTLYEDLNWKIRKYRCAKCNQVSSAYFPPVETKTEYTCLNCTIVPLR